MNVRRRLIPRGLVAAVAALAPAGDGAPALAGSPTTGTQVGTCADPDAAAAGWQCATFKAPKDYSHPDAGSVKLAVTRLPAQDQAHRIGALFVNPGGPGGSAVDFAQGERLDLFGPFNDHFDIVAFDPRGTGASSRRSTARSTRRRRASTRRRSRRPRTSTSRRCWRRTRLRQALRRASTRASCRSSRRPTPRVTWTPSAPRWATRS